MGRPGFSDLIDREALLEKPDDRLPKIDVIVDREVFRSALEGVRDKPREPKAGRKRFDSMLMFKVSVLRQMSNLGDDEPDYRIKDRCSLCRFLRLTPVGRVLDAKTSWLFREPLRPRGLIEPLFAAFSRQIERAGCQARKGQIVDASIVSSPRQRNGREDNARIEAGEPPEDWHQNKRRQKDVEARWTKKHAQRDYGYNNHISADRDHKLICGWKATTASVHDRQVFGQLIGPDNTSADVCGGSPCRCREQQQALAALGYRSHIHRKAQPASHFRAGRSKPTVSAPEFVPGSSPSAASRRPWVASW